MKLNKFIIERQVSEFRTDNGLSSSEPITLKSLLLKLNVLTIFRPLSENFSGMCLKDNSGHRFMLINSNQPRGRQAAEDSRHEHRRHGFVGQKLQLLEARQYSDGRRPYQKDGRGYAQSQKSWQEISGRSYCTA